MELAFIVLSIIVSAIRHMIAVYDQEAILPYVHGMRVFCILTDIVFLVSSVFYLGFLWGIVYFLLHYFSILFAVCGWIVTFPSNLFTKTPSSIQKTITFESSALVLLLLVLTVFTVVSFFVVPFKCLIFFVVEHWVILLSICGSLAVLRFAILHIYKD